MQFSKEQSFRLPKDIKQKMQKIIDYGGECYVIGGAVRDMLLGVQPHDYDLFCNLTGEEILEIFPKGNVIGGEKRQDKILTVIVDDVEISQYRKNGDRTETGLSLGEHQLTCDFTINSLAMDINGEIYDFTGGYEDLENKTLRFVGNPMDRINEDVLRILRGIRFAAKLKFKFEEQSGELININIFRISRLPQERVRGELMKILSYPNGMKSLIDYGLIDYIFPEYKDVKDMKGGQFHDEPVDGHMLNSFKESCIITDKVILRLGIFLHDIGKGVTQTFDYIPDETFDKEGFEGKVDIVDVKCSKKQTHFYEHEKRGQEMMERRLFMLKFSNDDIKYITTLIKWHMYSYKDGPSKKSYIRFFNVLEEANIPIEDYIMLIYCDNQGNMAKPRIKFGDFIKGNWLYKKYYEIKYSEEPMKVTDLKIGGQDVIDRLNIKPGKKIGEILNKLFEKVMDGDMANNRADLLHALKEYKNEK